MARSTTGSKKTEPLFLLWLLNPSTAAVELSALHRFHGVCMDLEHGAFNRESVDRLVLLAHSLRLSVYARVMAPTRIAAQHVLDSGADGVIIPHIDGLEHAREVTGYCKYPSLGTRSVGGGRTWGWGNPPDDWIRRENRRVQCFPMIETAEALEEVDGIAALPTVDGLFLGPFDLNMARGRGGRMGTAEDASDLRRVAQAARKAGKHWGMNIYSAPDRQVARRLGLRLAAMSDDVTVLSSGLAQVIEDARRDMPG